jgi:hypothetical protein
LAKKFLAQHFLLIAPLALAAARAAKPAGSNFFKLNL